MKTRKLSNQLDFIAEAISFWTPRVDKYLYTGKNLWRVRDLAKRKITDLYLHIHKVKNQLDLELKGRARDIRIHRETQKEIKQYNEKYGEDSWYEDWENRKPI